MSQCEVDECWLYHSVKWTSVGCVTVSNGRVLVVSQCQMDECWLCRSVKWTSVGCVAVSSGRVLVMLQWRPLAPARCTCRHEGVADVHAKDDRLPPSAAGSVTAGHRL